MFQTRNSLDLLRQTSPSMRRPGAVIVKRPTNPIFFWLITASLSAPLASASVINVDNFGLGTVALEATNTSRVASLELQATPSAIGGSVAPKSSYSLNTFLFKRTSIPSRIYLHFLQPHKARGNLSSFIGGGKCRLRRDRSHRRRHQSSHQCRFHRCRLKRGDPNRSLGNQWRLR